MPRILQQYFSKAVDIGEDEVAIFLDRSSTQKGIDLVIYMTWKTYDQMREEGQIIEYDEPPAPKTREERLAAALTQAHTQQTQPAQTPTPPPPAPPETLPELTAEDLAAAGIHIVAGQQVRMSDFIKLGDDAGPDGSMLSDSQLETLCRVYRTGTKEAKQYAFEKLLTLTMPVLYRTLPYLTERRDRMEIALARAEASKRNPHEDSAMPMELGNYIHGIDQNLIAIGNTAARSLGDVLEFDVGAMETVRPGTVRADVVRAEPEIAAALSRASRTVTPRGDLR